MAGAREESGSQRDSAGFRLGVELLEGGGAMGGRPVDLAGLGWSTGSGLWRCGEEQSRGRHGGEDGAARWGRDVSERKARARDERVVRRSGLKR